MMQTVKLKDVVMRVKDKIDKDNTHLEYYIGGEHIDSGELCITKKGKLEGSTIGPAFHMHFMPGDVLLMSRNPHLKKAGVVDFEGICSDVSYICRTKDENILSQKYLPFVFQTDHFWKFVEENKKGGLPFFLNWSDFEKYEFQLPDIDKQREMADLLWAAQETKLAYIELLKQTDELVKSQFIEMFGTILETIYPIEKLGNYAHIKHGYAFKGEFFTEHDNGILLVTPGNFCIGGGFQYKKCKYFTGEYSQDYVLNAGDLIVTMTDLSKESDTLGNAALVPNDGYVYLHNQRIGLFEQLNEKIDKSYLEFYMRTDDYRQHILSGATGSTVKHTSPTKILETKIIVPPLDKQKEFLTIKLQSDKSKFEIKKSIENINGLMKSLMQEHYNN